MDTPTAVAIATAAIQSLGLFILAGISKRVERLEDYIMGEKWNGHERRARG